MADITQFFGGALKAAAPELPADPPEVQVKAAMAEVGITPPSQIIMDGQLHRFKSGTKGRPGEDKAGWYVIYGDGVPAGSFGCWRAGIEANWRANIGRTMTAEEEMALARRMAAAKRARDEERAKARETATEQVDKIWTAAAMATADHPYLTRKGVKPHGARVGGDGRLILPLYDETGNLSSLQYIDADGGKLYHKGAATKSTVWQVGEDGVGAFYIAEGFATAATVAETTGGACMVAYSAGNLPEALRVARDIHGALREIIIIADNDASGVGQKYAEQAAAKYGAKVIVPPSPGDANDYAQAGHNLVDLLTPPKQEWLVHADDFSNQPAPIKWLIKGWLQEHAFCMVHGPSGSGKTFFVLDMLLSIAAGLPSWHEHKVKPGKVVYLAGEGHHGLRARIQAWKQHHDVQSLDMWVSVTACDLNTPQGASLAVESVRELNVKPDIICVDTLRRFFVGDENSAKDAKGMIDISDALRQEFGAAIVYVHHTGHAKDAQERGSGSTAWRGSTDNEFSVLPQEKGGEKIIILKQTKMKDSDALPPAILALDSVPIDGWLDEDGDPVTSAVVRMIGTAEKPTDETKELQELIGLFRESWERVGGETRDGMPFVSKAAMRDYLVEKMGIEYNTADSYSKPSAKTGPVAKMLTAGIIEKKGYGFVLIDGAASFQFMNSN
jgi:phage/plasmid primase-like uncharacterized protein